MISLIVAVDNREVFKNNILSSPIFNNNENIEIIIQEGYKSISKAYNDAIKKANNDLLVFAHQDIYFPRNWIDNLYNSISYLDIIDPQWGVLGCFGITNDGIGYGHLYSTGLKRVLGTKMDYPVKVQTLDEIVLVIRKSSGLNFDADLQSFHMYGTDLCLNALENNRNSYAISAFCIHNSNKILYLTNEFYECAKYIKKRWRKYLPINTSCLRIDNIPLSMYKSILKSNAIRLYSKKQRCITRVKCPENILINLENSGII